MSLSNADLALLTSKLAKIDEALNNLSAANTGDLKLTAMGAVGNPKGASLSATGQNLTLQPADSNDPGFISSTTQTFGGAKTFTSPITVSALTNQLTMQSSGSSTITAPSPTPVTFTFPDIGANYQVQGGFVNRRNVDQSGTTTLTNSQSYFFIELSLPSYGANVNVNLPAISSANKGVYYIFIVETAFTSVLSTDISIVSSEGANINGNLIAPSPFPPVKSFVNKNSIKIKPTAVNQGAKAGDRIYIVNDGSSWFATIYSTATSSIGGFDTSPALI